MELYLHWVRVSIFHAMVVYRRNCRQIKLGLLVIRALLANVPRGQPEIGQIGMFVIFFL